MSQYPQICHVEQYVTLVRAVILIARLLKYVLDVPNNQRALDIEIKRIALVEYFAVSVI
jgi:hypothetical protein